jgi:hypothetical protein
MGKLGDIDIKTDLITVSKVKCFNTNCIHNLVAYPGGWISCNLKHLEIGVDGMCLNKQETKKLGASYKG